MRIGSHTVQIKGWWNENSPHFLNAFYTSYCEQGVCVCFFFFNVLTLWVFNQNIVTGPSRFIYLQFWVQCPHLKIYFFFGDNLLHLDVCINTEYNMCHYLCFIETLRFTNTFSCTTSHWQFYNIILQIRGIKDQDIIRKQCLGMPYWAHLLETVRVGILPCFYLHKNKKNIKMLFWTSPWWLPLGFGDVKNGYYCRS